MDTLILLLASLLVAGLVTWRMLIGSARAGHHERNATSSVRPMAEGASELPQTDAYKAVSLRVCANPCGSALDLRGQTFLLHKVPQLPLSTCDRRCHCKFSSHDDRRIKKDRRHPAKHYGSDVCREGMEDRRNNTDRRARRSRRRHYQGLH